MISRLSSEGIDMTHVIRDPQHASGVAFIMIDKSGENMISVAPGANFYLDKSDIIKASKIVKNATALVVQMEIPIETIDEIFKIASEGNVIKILNPAPLKTIPINILKHIDIIIPNEGELYRLYSLLNLPEIKSEGKTKIIQISKAIADLGIQFVITTLGSKGSLIYKRENDEIIEIPAIKVKAVDTVGAGDCFNGVLASKLCDGESIINAVKYATTGASLAVTRKGAQDSMPYAEEIEKQFKKLSQYTS